MSVFSSSLAAVGTSWEQLKVFLNEWEWEKDEEETNHREAGEATGVRNIFR